MTKFSLFCVILIAAAVATEATNHANAANDGPSEDRPIQSAYRTKANDEFVNNNARTTEYAIACAKY